MILMPTCRQHFWISVISPLIFIVSIYLFTEGRYDYYRKINKRIPAKNDQRGTLYDNGHVIDKSRDVDCSRLFAGDPEAINEARNVKATSSNPDYVDLAANCVSYVSGRGYLTSLVSSEEADYPIAYSIQVYRDLIQIETLLVAIYRPQNYYCINVDVTADVHLHLGMTSIATCFSNVFIVNVDVEWAQYSQIEADMVLYLV
ncbi:hypothetical protein LSH36_280g01056 [Paralvinella palmiformis]|uniref:Uncharacterized protein n=1 Tax=Paralvinella palmiformis TaxID=53620 RepID=A0AAD9JJ61_9ANNE|nr:hypothetical protein LSH36_280g01056 [Paralvinella palmiformis]